MSPIAASIRRIATRDDPPVQLVAPRARHNIVPLTVVAVLLAPLVLFVGWLADGSLGAVSLLAGVLAGVGVLALARAITVARRMATHAERRRLVRQVIQATESERTRIASDLHDGPIQQLAVLAYNVHRIRRRLGRGDLHAANNLLDELEAGLTNQVGGLRQLMTELRPPILDSDGLESALKAQMDRLASEHGMETHCDVAVRRLGEELETVLYRVAQEALTNVAKHARARRVAVSLRAAGSAVVLSVRDDGTGFDPSRTGEFLRDGHFGLTGMRERVAILGGQLQVQSTPGQGTVLEARFLNRADGE